MTSDRLSEEDVEAIHDDADPECSRCGGTGEVVKMIAGRSGMVPCPVCRPEAGI